MGNEKGNDTYMKSKVLNAMLYKDL